MTQALACFTVGTVFDGRGLGPMKMKKNKVGKIVTFISEFSIKSQNSDFLLRILILISDF